MRQALSTKYRLVGLVMSIFLAFSIAGCEGDDGAPGADGTVGVDGAPGRSRNRLGQELPALSEARVAEVAQQRPFPASDEPGSFLLERPGFSYPATS